MAKKGVERKDKEKKEWKKRGKIPKNPFVELSKKLKNRYNSKAICDYYWNILEPRLNHEPFSQEEKEYIYKWEVDKENKDDYKICKSENEDEIEFDEYEDKNEAKPFTKHSIQ
ncbi:hypothetical protein C1646_819076 [Rhizophagus diaphanus]|nr:hypothetical protein C1646_819076 [Rhizophagus diaphanus] [Rhizophagus sp. MUCL 43196]